MSTTYTSQEVARILKVSETELRACLRAALFPAQRAPRRFTFQDLLLLQTAKRLCDAKIPIARIRRLLQSLKRQLPDAESLSNLKIYADGRRVVVWDGEARWQPDSGQFLFNFEPVAPGREPVPLITKAAKRSRESATPTAEHWMVRAMEFEAESPDEAKRAYLEALQLQPDLVDAHIQLGLLHHREGQLPDAERCYRKAVEYAPDEALGHFNLGVVFTDQGNRRAAIAAYETVVTLLPSCADAHYHLGTLYEAEGQHAQAIRHYAAAKKLLKGKRPQRRLGLTRRSSPPPMSS